MDETVFKARIITALSDVSPDAWNKVANPPGLPYDPFLSWEFLEALESSGAARPETGWSPCHILVEGPGNELLAAMPLYAKTHSQGEFVFDHSWADAYERAGGNYFPKLLSAVPFTPVTGRRFLLTPGPDQDRLRNALLSAALQVAVQNDFSSLHINFIEPDFAALMDETGLLIRTDQQFHWSNDSYQNFDDFLAALSSAKRKNLRKERAKAQAGLSFKHLTGDAIKEHHWDAFFEFYMDTGSRKWGYPYLNRDTFSLLGERMADKILLILAYDDDVPIAGALNLIGSDTLYGRYWGCTDPRPFLHFETCYYQAIDYAIAHGLSTVEAGAQGGHKLARGYVPVTTYSAHWIAHKGLRDAIDHYLERERQAVEHESSYLQKRTPFKKSE
ncbi:MAG: GNAT family N-acetyltransferase [Hyphomonadaceae bacterium]|nr:GNAT family N-acetyltransferase [Hyphomonadaceae bacterium]